ncbi:MAG TPA: hypothetical protein VEJ41_05415 [Candidatus Acidoferrales bacterium]|nr:hypothetical protein [Candidatus Acidoferrales bacterium]
MNRKTTAISLAGFGAIAACALIVACSTGGGGGSGSGTGPINNPSPQPSPTLSPGLTDTMQVSSGGSYPVYTYDPASDAGVVFSCGCSAQAGTTTADGAGAIDITPDSTATPSVPNPTYTMVAGRNYIVVATTGAGAEAWTIQFAGRNPSRNHYLNGMNPSDVYSAAVALYVFNNSPLGETAFDDWNFNKLVEWYGTLQNSPNGAEETLLNYIASRSAANETLFPAAPSWNPGQAHDSTMAADLVNVKMSGDPTIPQPCPSSGCAGEPTP